MAHPLEGIGMRRKKPKYEDDDRGIRGLLDEAEDDAPADKKKKRSTSDEDDDLDIDSAWTRG